MRGVLSGKSLDFSRKYQYSNCYQIHNLKDNIMTLFQRIALLLLISDFREGQAETWSQNWKKL